MDLEWPEAKRQKTLADRGLDFADVASLVWETALTAEDTREYGETRYVTLGFIGNRLCVLAWCYRDERIRIISLRKANAREVRRYEG